MKKAILGTVLVGGFLITPAAHAATANDQSNVSVDADDNEFFHLGMKTGKNKQTVRDFLKDAFGDNENYSITAFDDEDVIDTSHHEGTQFNEAFNQHLDNHADNEFYTVKPNGKKQFTKEEVDATWNDIKNQIMSRANSQQNANVSADDNEFRRR